VAVTARKYRWVREAFSVNEDNAQSFLNHNKWAKEGEKLDPDDRLWKQYMVFIDLYKYYFDIIWKVSTGYYVAAFVLLSFIINKRASVEEGPLSLLLAFLILVSLGFSYIMWKGARNLAQLSPSVEYIALSLRLPGRVHIEIATVYLLLNSAMLIGISAGCLVLILWIL
jgi:hypothetical protein